MAGSSFPISAQEVVSTLVEIARHRGNRELFETLNSAHARFDDRGQSEWGRETYWAFCIQVPISVFASFESRLDQLEKVILDKLKPIVRPYQYDVIQEVIIIPTSEAPTGPVWQATPPDFEVHQIWPEGKFRLFLSHISAFKVEVSKLKSTLSQFGIAAFVAHEDIEPSKEWQREIEIALRSMHALAAIVTNGFHESIWTDQEIGWALGRNVAVFPIRIDGDPYGFFGKYQAIPGDLGSINPLADSIVETLLNNAQTHAEMRHSLAIAFLQVRSFLTAISLSKKIIKIDDFTEEEKTLLYKACEENDQVYRAHNVKNAIHAKFDPPKTEPDDIPF